MVKLPKQAQLRRRREELGLSRRELAERAGVPVSRIWAVEDPSAEVDPDVREKIVRALNAHLNHIANLGEIT